MKTKHQKAKTKSSALFIEPSENDIREYAYHLYIQKGCVPGRDLENWTEAKASLCVVSPEEQGTSSKHSAVEKTVW